MATAALAPPDFSPDALRVEHLTAVKIARARRYQALYGEPDPERRRELLRADATLCAADPVYWIDEWGYVRNEKVQDPDLRDSPFVLWPSQVELARWLIERREKGQAAVIPKSREKGVSWLVCHLLYHGWRWRGASATLASRVENLVDLAGDMDSLFEKIRYIHRWQPLHLKEPRVLSKHMVFKNLRNGAELKGTSTNKDPKRGGRSEVYFFDEFPAIPPRLADGALAASESVSRSRWIIGNPDRPDHPFERLRGQLTTEQVKEMPWRTDPYLDEAWRRSVELPTGTLTPEQAQQEYDCVAGAVSGHKIFTFREEVVGYREPPDEKPTVEWMRQRNLARSAYFCAGGWDFGSGDSLLANVQALVEWREDPRDFHLWLDWARTWRGTEWATAAGDVREAMAQYGGHQLHFGDPTGVAKDSGQGSWISNLQAGRVPVWPLPWTINTTENRDWAIKHLQYLLDAGRFHVNVSREGGRMVLAAMRAWERDVPDWVRDLDVISRAHVAPKKDGNSHVCEAVLYLVCGVLLMLRQRIAEKGARDQSPQTVQAQLSALSGPGSRGSLSAVFAELYGGGR